MFKVGDKVVCVDDSNVYYDRYNELKSQIYNDHIYVIERIIIKINTDLYYVVLKNNNIKYKSTRFKLLTELRNEKINNLLKNV